MSISQLGPNISHLRLPQKTHCLPYTTGDLICFSCPVAVSWQWWSMTLWPVTVAAASCRCAEARLWKFLNDSTTSRIGAWCGPQTALLLRRASCPAPCSASLTPGLPWRWRGSSTTKVNWNFFLSLTHNHALRSICKANWLHYILGNSTCVTVSCHTRTYGHLKDQWQLVCK